MGVRGTGAGETGGWNPAGRLVTRVFNCPGGEVNVWVWRRDYWPVIK